MAVLDQLNNSKLSLQGNGFRPTPQQADWGYSPLSPPVLQPDLSELHYNRSLSSTVINIGYSVDGISVDESLKYIEAAGPAPTTGFGIMRVFDYNRLPLGGITYAPPSSRLDELDPNAPKNNQAGAPLPTPLYNNVGPVVSQIYKSLRGKQYKDLGPKSGRY